MNESVWRRRVTNRNWMGSYSRTSSRSSSRRNNGRRDGGGGGQARKITDPVTASDRAMDEAGITMVVMEMAGMMKERWIIESRRRGWASGESEMMWRSGEGH
jgi:hypothetical protein